jgi:glycosyltransferase involved in cell wall biosynthesis
MLTDRVVCVSEAAKLVVVHGGLESEKVAVIYGGVKPPQLSVDGKSERMSNQLRSDLGVTIDQTLLVSVGSLLDCKGHSDLIRSLQLNRFDDTVRLLIAGEGPERSKLESEIQQLGLSDCVTLLGHREDAMNLLRAADLVVHPSHAEGLSLVLIQAQMLRRPIVATAVGGAAEVLQCDSPNPKSTWIAPPGDSEGLADQIRLALNALREPESRTIVHKNLELVAQRSKLRFDVRSAAQSLVDLASEIRGMPVPRNAA